MKMTKQEIVESCYEEEMYDFVNWEVVGRIEDGELFDDYEWDEVLSDDDARQIQEAVLK